MDSLLAGAIATRADAIRTALLKVLKQPDEWKNGINIRLVGEPGSPVPANPVRMQTVIVGNTLSYSISFIWATASTRTACAAPSSPPCFMK